MVESTQYCSMVTKRKWWCGGGGRVVGSMTDNLEVTM